LEEFLAEPSAPAASEDVSAEPDLSFLSSAPEHDHEFTWPDSDTPASTDTLDETEVQSRAERGDSSAPPPAEPYDFSVACPLCGTRQDTDSEHIGGTLRCPDCHFVFDVSEPHRSARRPRGALGSPEDDSFQLEELPDSGPWRQLAGGILDAASKEAPSAPTESERADAARTKPARSQPARPFTPADAIQQTLRAAEKEFEERERAIPQIPSRPLSTGVMKFMFDTMTVGRWLIMSLVVQVEVAAIQMSLAAAEGGGIAQVMGIFLRVFATIVGVLGACFISTSLLRVVEESSLGQDAVEHWPGINVTDWFFESWPMFASLFLTLAPGLAIGQMAYSISGSAGWLAAISIGAGSVALAIAFPVLLLSFLESYGPYSKPIWNSLSLSRSSWSAFWRRAAAIVTLGCAITYVRWSAGFSTVVNAVLVAIAMFLVLLYFRLLGRLSWACDQDLRKAAEAVHESVDD
jgi:hypothetical protein